MVSYNIEMKKGDYWFFVDASHNTKREAKARIAFLRAQNSDLVFRLRRGQSYK